MSAARGPPEIRILLVEDNPADADLVRESLAETSARVDLVHVERVSAALERAAGGDRDVVLMDMGLPDASELAGVRRLHAAFPKLPIVVLTGTGDERVGPRAVAEGAQDFLTKGLEGSLLLRTLRHAVERQQYSERALLLAEERAAHASAEQAKRKAQILSEASRALSASLDQEAVISAVARLLVPEIADWCAIEVAGDEAPGSRLVAVVHGNPAKAEAARRLRELWASGREASPGVARVMRTGEGELLSEIQDAALADWVRDADHRELVRQVGLGSAIIMPMRAHGTVFGAITLAASSPGRRYRPEDLALAEEIGSRAGTAIEHARLYRQAQEAIGARDEFLAIASHELRTPLTALHLHLQSAHRRISAPDDLSRRVAEITRKIEGAIRSSERMASLIDTLLDVSRITTGRFTLSKEGFDATAVVREVVERFGGSAEYAGCKLTLHADGPAHGQWDKIRVEQAVANLLSNALKYAAGSPVDVDVTSGERSVTVTVSDGGPGIPKEHLPRIFERFERGTSVRQLGGLGLGLYVTRQIAEAHGGELEASNLPAGGARFTLRLPLGP